MNLDRLLHQIKNFAELTDSDVGEFLRDRPFGSENLNVEFKQEFPLRSPGGKYEIREICKYIVGLSNEEGGLVIYGVSDAIKDKNTPYPSYVKGLHNYPSLEDLSQWVRERVHPLISSPSIRFFTVAGKQVVILKVPSGANKPYCYHDPGARTVTYFKKTSGGIAELTPDEIREFHRTQMLDQALRLVLAAESEGIGRVVSPSVARERLREHKQCVGPKLENLKDFG